MTSKRNPIDVQIKEQRDELKQVHDQHDAVIRATDKTPRGHARPAGHQEEHDGPCDPADPYWTHNAIWRAIQHEVDTVFNPQYEPAGPPWPWENPQAVRKMLGRLREIIADAESRLTEETPTPAGATVSATAPRRITGRPTN